MVRKAFYGISSKTGKVLIVGDEDNFPKKESNVWMIVISTVILLSVFVFACVMVTPKLPLGQ